MKFILCLVFFALNAHAEDAMWIVTPPDGGPNYTSEEACKSSNVGKNCASLGKQDGTNIDWRDADVSGKKIVESATKKADRIAAEVAAAAVKKAEQDRIDALALKKGRTQAETDELIDYLLIKKKAAAAVK